MGNDGTPFGTYVRNNMIPGASSDGVASSYYTRRTLQDAGWNPDAVRWADSTVPVQYDDAGLPSGTGAAYYPGRPPRQYETGFTVPGDPGHIAMPSSGDDKALSYYLEHEQMHAWENAGNPGGSMSLPPAIRQQDFDAALGEMQRWPWDRVGHDPNAIGNWRGTGTPTTPQRDDAHYTQTLWNMGYKPEDVPQWYRDKYLSEYEPSK